MRLPNFLSLPLLAAVGLHIVLIAALWPWVLKSFTGVAGAQVQVMQARAVSEDGLSVNSEPISGNKNEQSQLPSRATRPLLPQATTPSFPHAFGGNPGNQIQQAQIQPLLRQLAQLLQAHLVYPQDALNQSEEGKVVLKFTLLPSGNIENITVLQSSRYRRLDQAAMETIQAIEPVEMSEKILTPITVEVPVDFQ